MVNENVIAPLEQSLRQIQQTLSQKESRLREIEREANGLKEDIGTLKSSAEQIKTTIRSLLDGGQSRKSLPNRQTQVEMEIGDVYDGYDDDQDDLMPRYAPQPKRNQHNGYQQNNYQQQPPQQQRSVVPMHRGGTKFDVPATNPNLEPRNYRFRDRTITQACSVLMREASRPLHVNEIYNRLLEGGMVFTGNNPTISIAVSLNRNRRFRKVAPGTFDLVMRDASQQAS